MIRYNKRDWLFAGLATLIVLILAGCQITPGVSWGDDYAAYIQEGISIAEGSFRDQTKINYQYHPSPLPDEAKKDESLVYAWGYPLVLSAVYRIVGFDRVGYTSIIWYKIPLLLSLALTGGVLTLLLRRRFSIYVSAGAALVFCMSGNMFDAVNSLYSDLQFLFLSVLTFLLMECYEYEIGKQTTDRKRSVWLSLAYGVVMWLTYETRLSGFTVCAAALVGHSVAMLRKRVDKETVRLHALPYLLLIFLVLISEHLWLAPATPNLSDIGKTSEVRVFEYYRKELFNFFDQLPMVPFSGLGYVLIGACVLGVMVKGWTENLYLTLLLIGTLVVDLSLPYTNGLRYVYNILPIIIMYMVYGFQTIARFFNWISEKSGVKPIREAVKLVGLAAAMAVLFFSLSNQVFRAGLNLASWGDNQSYDAYSTEAKEMYSYINEALPPDTVICFGKPRLMYLSTGHQSFKVGVNGHEMREADYYLKNKVANLDDTSVETDEMEIVKENQCFVMYWVK